MTSPQANFVENLSSLETAESVIFNSLNQTTDELAHAECFDQEQRAEIYAILQAIKTDTENHRQMIQLLAQKLNRNSPDA
jgi:hypothetical protein